MSMRMAPNADGSEVVFRVLRAGGHGRRLRPRPRPVEQDLQTLRDLLEQS